MKNKEKKRYQECNKLEKVWRRIWYLLIPFMFVYQSIKGMKIYEDDEVDGKLVHTNKYFIPNSKMLWSLLIGTAQIKMNWTYTSEAVFGNVRTKIDLAKDKEDS